MTTRAEAPHFHVAFDTSALFVDAENKLIKEALSKFILERNKAGFPKVTWHLPDIVRAERRYQMLQVALKLLTHVDKVGRLLGQDFGITKASLEHGINSVIADEAKRHELNIRKLDAGLVDWNALIDRSTSRDPPFESGTKEKGFRDSIVLETFAQLVDEERSKDQHFVLMTNDKLLKAAVAERVRGKNDVLTAADVETIESMLNAYASRISGQELEELLEKAQQLFYREDDSERLFYKWRVEEIIRDKYSAALLEPPPASAGEAYVTARLSSVGPSTFIEKSDQRIIFATYLIFDVGATTPFSSGAGPYRSTSVPYAYPIGTAMMNNVSLTPNTIFLNTGSLSPNSSTSVFYTGGLSPST